MKQFLEAGEFVTTHGVTGELKLYPWSDAPDFLLPFHTLYLDKNGAQPLKVEQMRIHKNLCLVKLAGVASIEQARPYIGKTVYIARQDARLPPDKVFVQDLLGARVQDAATGQDYGEITAVTHPGRHDVYEITAADGEKYLFPAVEAFLDKVDVEAGVVRVKPIAGMFEKEPPPKTARRKTHNRGKVPRDDTH